MIRTTLLAAGLLLTLTLSVPAGIEGRTAAEPDDDVVVWRAGERLTWTDFRADPSGRGWLARTGECVPRSSPLGRLAKRPGSMSVNARACGPASR